MIFQVFQQLVKLFLAAAAVGEDLHLIADAPRHPGLNVPQVDVLLLRRGEKRRRMGSLQRSKQEVDLSAHLKEPQSSDQTADLVLQGEHHRRLASSLGRLPVSCFINGTEGRTSGLQATTPTSLSTTTMRWQQTTLTRATSAPKSGSATPTVTRRTAGTHQGQQKNTTSTGRGSQLRQQQQSPLVPTHWACGASELGALSLLGCTATPPSLPTILHQA